MITDDDDEPQAVEPLVVKYKNYRGEVSVRKIEPQSVRWGSTEWHPQPCWLLYAWDHDKGAYREFAMHDMLGPASFKLSDMKLGETIPKEVWGKHDN